MHNSGSGVCGVRKSGVCNSPLPCSVIIWLASEAARFFFPSLLFWLSGMGIGSLSGIAMEYTWMLIDISMVSTHAKARRRTKTKHDVEGGMHFYLEMTLRL